MSNNLPAGLSKTMPINAVVDYSGQISQTELATLDSYAARMHYSPHVVLLPAAMKGENTQTLALQMATSWNLEPNGFLLVVNPAADTAAMVAGNNLQTKGVTGKFITTHLMPNRFEKEYALGNTYGAIRTTMGAVEHKLNAVALRGQQVQYQQQQQHASGGAPVGLIFFGFFFFFAFMVYVAGRSSISPRRMRLEGNTYQGNSDLSSDLARIHQLMGDGPATKQVPMKEFAQRAGSSRSTQDSLDALETPEHESEFPHRSSTRLTNYSEQMIAQDLAVAQKSHSDEKKKPLKLIFEGAHAGEKFAAPTASEEVVAISPAQAPEASFSVPTFKPYEFPEDETVLPSVNSLEAASATAVPDPNPSLITLPTAAPTAAPSAVAPSSIPAPLPSLQVQGQEPDLTTENVLKVDQFAQAMTSEPDLAASLPAWQPPTYTPPPAPVMPQAPTLPVAHFNSSFSSDFANILSSSTASIGSGSVTPSATDSASSGQLPAAGVCPQCQSERSPDFSFCLRCGHMFV